MQGDAYVLFYKWSKLRSLMLKNSQKLIKVAKEGNNDDLNFICNDSQQFYKPLLLLYLGKNFFPSFLKSQNYSTDRFNGKTPVYL